MERIHLRLGAGDRAAHDEAMPAHPAVPLGTYPLHLHVLEARPREPLRTTSTFWLKANRVVQSMDVGYYYNIKTHSN